MFFNNCTSFIEESLMSTAERVLYIGHEWLLLHKIYVLRPLKGYKNIAKPGYKRRENVYKQGDSRAHVPFQTGKMFYICIPGHR